MQQFSTQIPLVEFFRGERLRRENDFFFNFWVKISLTSNQRLCSLQKKKKLWPNNLRTGRSSIIEKPTASMHPTAYCSITKARDEVFFFNSFGKHRCSCGCCFFLRVDTWTTVQQREERTACTGGGGREETLKKKRTHVCDPQNHSRRRSHRSREATRSVSRKLECIAWLGTCSGLCSGFF